MAQEFWSVPRQSKTYGAADTTKDFTLSASGVIPRSMWCKGVLVNMPNFTNGVTATLSLLNSAGSTLFSQAAIAENLSTWVAVDRPINGSMKFVVLLDGVPGGAGGAVTLDIYCQK